MSPWENNANITLIVRSLNKREGLERKYGEDQYLANKRLPVYAGSRVTINNQQVSLGWPVWLSS